MFKNLSMYLFDVAPADASFEDATNCINLALYDAGAAKDLISNNPPKDPAHGQISAWGLLPVDDLIIDMALQDVPHRFLPLTLVIRERVIDKAAVNFAVNRKAEEISKQESRIVGRKERQALADEIVFSMIQKAPIKEKRVSGYVCSTGNILVNATGKAAEDYVAALKVLFGTFYARPADLFSYGNMETQNELDEALITKFGIAMIDPLDLSEVKENAEFESTGSFSFQLTAKEKIDCQGASETTIQDIFSRLDSAALRWIELSHEHATFKLNSDLTLRSIKLNDLEYTPDNDEEAGLSAAYHRFYLNFFVTLFNTVVLAVCDFAEEQEDV